jgi:hypothetical protein
MLICARGMPDIAISKVAHTGFSSPGRVFIPQEYAFRELLPEQLNS